MSDAGKYRWMTPEEAIEALRHRIKNAERVLESTECDYSIHPIEDLRRLLEEDSEK